MTAKHFALLIFALTAWTLQQPAASVSGDLSIAERRAIDSGVAVMRQEVVASSAWPKVTVYKFADATPLETAAVFADYERHSTYISGLTKSVARTISPRVSEVDYVLEVPLYRDEDYTVRDSVSADSARTRYRVDWTMVRARSTKQIVGHARFEPYRNARLGKDGTLITYVNLVSPGQALAGLFKGRAIGQVRETAAAIAKQVEEERAGDRGLLASQVAALVAALAATNSPP